MHPIDHISTAVEYSFIPRRSSGDLQHKQHNFISLEALQAKKKKNLLSERLLTCTTV